MRLTWQGDMQLELLSDLPFPDAQSHVQCIPCVLKRACAVPLHCTPTSGCCVHRLVVLCRLLLLAHRLLLLLLLRTATVRVCTI